MGVGQRSQVKIRQKPKRRFCTKNTPTKTTSDSGTLCKMVFWCFWGFPIKRPQNSRNHYKNSGFGEISVTVSKGVFGRDDWEGDLVPEPGGFGLAKPFRFNQSFFSWIPLAKMLGSAVGSVYGTKSPLLGDQIPFLQHIYVCVYVERERERERGVGRDREKETEKKERQGQKQRGGDTETYEKNCCFSGQPCFSFLACVCVWGCVGRPKQPNEKKKKNNKEGLWSGSQNHQSKHKREKNRCFSVVTEFCRVLGSVCWPLKCANPKTENNTSAENWGLLANLEKQVYWKNLLSWNSLFGVQQEPTPFFKLPLSCHLREYPKIT